MCLWKERGNWGEERERKKITFLTGSPVCIFSLTDLNTQITIAEGY